MATIRPLRGGCQCGRNRYIIIIPQEGLERAQVHFNTKPVHHIPLGTFSIRVPLSWYHSTTHAFYPDETHSMIRRVYENHAHEHSKRHFCGFCGTPLSYWSESPETEADYINLNVGSLLREAITDLDEIGLIPDAAESSSSPADALLSTAVAPGADAIRQSFGVPWFDALIEGTPLGRMRRTQGIEKSADGDIQIEWEVVEYTEGSDDQTMDTGSDNTPASTKRKFDDAQE